MRVQIYFEMPDRDECDTMFAYLAAHPKDLWDYEQRVKQTWTENKLFANFTAHWTEDDVLDASVQRLSAPDARISNVIQYEVTLRAGAKHPKILVDLLRRCRGVQEGVVGGTWKIAAFYQDRWTADIGNDGALDVRCVQDSTTDSVNSVSILLTQLKNISS